MGTQLQATGMSILHLCNIALPASIQVCNQVWGKCMSLKVGCKKAAVWRAGDAAGGEALQSYASKHQSLNTPQCFVLWITLTFKYLDEIWVPPESNSSALQDTTDHVEGLSPLFIYRSYPSIHSTHSSIRSQAQHQTWTQKSLLAAASWWLQPYAKHMQRLLLPSGDTDLHHYSCWQQPQKTHQKPRKSHLPTQSSWSIERKTKAAKVN